MLNYLQLFLWVEMAVSKGIAMKGQEVEFKSRYCTKKGDVVVYICYPRTSMTRLSSCLCFRNKRDPLPKMNPP